MVMEWISSAGSLVSRKGIGFLLILIHWLNVVSAQEVLYSFSREKGLTSQEFFYTPEDTLVVFYYNDRWSDLDQLTVFSFNHREIVKWMLPENAQWMGWLQSNGQLFAYYCLWEESAEMISFYEMRWMENHFSGSQIIYQYPYSKVNRTPKFTVQSRGEKMVFLSKSLTHKTKEILAFQFEGKSGDWRYQKSAIWKMDEAWNDWDIQRWTLDGNGDILLLTGENRDYRALEQRIVPPTSQLYYYQFDKQHLRQWDLLVGEKMLKEAYWQPYADSLMILGVICVNAGGDENKGWLRYVINTHQKEVIEQHYTPFEYPEGVSQEWIGMNSLLAGDHYFGLCGEHFHSEELRTTDFQTGRIYSHWVYHFNEIYFQLLDSTLQFVKDVSVVYKEQEGSDLEGVSFECNVNQQGLAIRYNDLEDNQPFQPAKKTWMGKRSVISQVMWPWTIEYQGMKEVNKREIKKSKGVFIPSSGNRGKYSIWWTINDILICKD
jgi:hypothetical protein